MKKSILVAMVLMSGLLSSCAENNWYYRKEQKLPGGGPLAKLKAEPTFTFVVVGDTRTGIKIFRKEIKEINLLSPDMVIDVGDMIPGYSTDKSKIESMWNQFDKTVAHFEEPLVMVAGNHDIWSPLSRKIYERRYGRTYFSFDYKGAHFIVLDSETLDENGAPINRISDEQIDWLKKDLSSHHNARAIFVFLHKPLWQDFHVGKGASQHWFNQVHPLFVKYKVSAVFAGHVHRYTKYPPIDGVHYYITGGGGAGLSCKPKEGGFYHYCIVRVIGKKWKMAVVKPGCIVPDDIVMIPADMMVNAEITSVGMLQANKPSAVTLKITNLSPDKKMKVIIKPSRGSNKHYKITPTIAKFEIKPKGKYDYKFNIVLDDIKNVYPAPKLTVQVEGLGEKVTSEKVIPIKKNRKCVCKRIKGKIIVDGKLEDSGWKNTEVLKDFWAPDTEHKAKFPTEARVGYDKDNLYIAVVCYEPNISGIVANAKKHDSNVWDDDCVEVFLDTNLDRKTYYHIIVNAKGVSCEEKGRNPKWDGKYAVKTSLTDKAWIAEFAIPWKTIGIDTQPKAGMKLGLELARNRAQSPSEITQWSPTFGGNHTPTSFGILIDK